MRQICVGLAVMLAGCATATVPEIAGTEPILTLALRGEPRAASKCVVDAIEANNMNASMRDFGDEIQVLWELQRKGVPLGLFTLHKAANGPGSSVDFRMSPGRDGEPFRKRWSKLLEGCQ